MSRYAAMFERLADGEGVFGAFVMLGDPDLETSAAILDALVEGGADMIEVGIPFSDPVADGPVIQAAAVRALAAGVRTADCFALLRGFRERHPDVPVGILTYANLVARARPRRLLRGRRRGRRRQRARRRRAAARGRAVRSPRRAAAGVAPVLIAAAQHAAPSGSRGSPRAARAIPIASPAPA